MRARKNPLPITAPVHSRLQGVFFGITGPIFVQQPEAREFTLSVSGQVFTRTIGLGKPGQRPPCHSLCRCWVVMQRGGVSMRSHSYKMKIKSCGDCSRAQRLTISNNFACIFSS